MNWTWVSSLDQLWDSSAFPMWLTLVSAGFFGIILFITILRAEKSVANGALTIITLLAIGVAVDVTIRGFGLDSRSATVETRSFQSTIAALPALACIDDMGGETVLTACERALFSSPESAAAALSYAASQITRLTAFGDVTLANPSMTSELLTLRRAVERDRYGLMAYVLAVRDHCTPSQCAVFQALTDTHQIVANMDERLYDGLIARYAPSWSAPMVPAAVLAPSMLPGKSTNADFPSATSTPPVSIMTSEPVVPSASRPPASVANAPPPSPRPATTTPVLTGAKKQVVSKSARAPKPVQPSPAAVEPEPVAADE